MNTFKVFALILAVAFVPQVAKADNIQWYVAFQGNPVLGPFPNISECQRGMQQYGLVFPNVCSSVIAAPPQSPPYVVVPSPVYVVAPSPAYVTVPIIPQYNPPVAAYPYPIYGRPGTSVNIGINLNWGGGRCCYGRGYYGGHR